MKTLNQQGVKSTTGITYIQYVKELEQNNLDLLTNCVIEEMGERYWGTAYTRKHVSPAMVHFALMEADPELYPTNNYAAYVQYEYGKISFPIETKLAICEDGYCAVNRIINALLQENPVYMAKLRAWAQQKGKEKPKAKTSGRSKSTGCAETKQIASTLLATTSLNCMPGKSLGFCYEVIKGGWAPLLRHGIICN